MKFPVLSDNIKRQKSTKKTHHLVTQWLSFITTLIKAFPNHRFGDIYLILTLASKIRFDNFPTPKI